MDEETAFVPSAGVAATILTSRTSSFAGSHSSIIGNGIDLPASSTTTTPPKSGTALSDAGSNNGVVINSRKSDLWFELFQQTFFAIALGFAASYVPPWFINASPDEISSAGPFQEFTVGKSKIVVLDSLLNQPLVDPATIPSSLLLWSAMGVPLFIVSAVSLCSHSKRNTSSTSASSWQRKIHDFCAGISGLIMALGISDGIIHTLKLYVRRRRPNFYALCGWSSERLLCTADKRKLLEATLSFPSGPSSLTCCGMMYLVWFLLAKILHGTRNNSINQSNFVKASWNVVSRRYQAALACALPWVWTLFVATSRVVDHWHHPADIVAGLILGGTCATACYHLWYPPIWTGPAVTSNAATKANLPWSLYNAHLLQQQQQQQSLSIELAKLASFVD